MTVSPPASPIPEPPRAGPNLGSDHHSSTPASLYRPPVGAPTQALNPYEDKQWATFAHLGGVAGFIPSLVIYLVYKDRGRFARQEAVEALNFQLTLVGANIICWVFTLIPIIGLIFGLALFGLWVVAIVFSIMGGVSANRGNPYRYPFTVRVIK